MMCALKNPPCCYYKIFLWLFFPLLFFSLLLFPPQKVCAQDYYRETLEFDPEGNLIMTTKDRIATGSITYKTIGWTIKRYDSGVYDPNNQCAFLPINTLEESRVDPNNSSYQYSYFYCDKTTIFNAIGSVSKEWQNSLYLHGGTVYLDAIMTVCEKGTPLGSLWNADPSYTGEVYFTFDGIVNARNWADPDALFTHFGKSLAFPANPDLLEPEDPSYSIYHYEVQSQQTLPLSRYEKDISDTFKDSLRVPIADFSANFFQFVSGTAQILYLDGSSKTWNFDSGSPPTILNSSQNISHVSIFLYYKRSNKTENLSLNWHYDPKTQIPKLTGSGRISANEANPEYDPSIAIPTGSYLDLQTTLDSYAFSINYKHHYGQFTLAVQIRTPFTLSWTDQNGTHTSAETLTEVYYVDRSYSFYVLDQWELYILNQVRVFQYAFTDTAAILPNSSPLSPAIHQVTRFNSHWFSPSFPSILTAPPKTLTKEGSKPSLPSNTQQALAESTIGPLQVQNDHFQVGNTCILSSQMVLSEAPAPELPTTESPVTLTQKGIKIPDIRHNYQENETLLVGIYESYGKDDQFSFSYYGNPVSLHTPVICTSQVSNDKKKNQLVRPDKNRASLILGQNFTIKTSMTGTHQEYPGYGTRDYSAYGQSIQINLPFEVYLGENYLAPNQWHTIDKLETFYLPTGVPEGNYTIRIQVPAINYHSAIDNTETTREAYANLNPEHTIATCQLEVQVMGRLYDFGFQLDRFYPVGTRNENGILTNLTVANTLPRLTGIAFTKPLPFSLTTIGNPSKEGEGIKIVPSFFHITKDGKSRQPVDIYYRTEGNLLEKYNPVIVLGQTNCTVAGSPEQNVLDRTTALTSVQYWEGTFTLPEPFVVLPKYQDLYSLLEEKGSLTPDNAEFLQDGFLLVNFSIYTIRNGKYYLSYRNASNAPLGYCNMWQTEGFSYSRTIHGNTFSFTDGDCLLFSLEDKNYPVFGTH